MAVFFNKWFNVSTLALVMVLNMGEKPYERAVEGDVHPFHVSVTEVNHNATDKTLEISCKLFTDDFEKVLAKNYNIKTDLIHPTNRAAMDSLIKKYIQSHLSIKVNGKPVSFSYLGFEHENEAVYSYVEVSNVVSAGKIEITNSLMYDLFDDQVGILHVTVNGSRKSSKLNYPSKEAAFSF
jgi:hypothetical protein